MNADTHYVIQGTARLGDLHDLLVEANINPRTGLATDYLNHFNEMVMLLELLPEDEAVGEDVAGWRPLGYLDYFAQSNFRAKALAMHTYALADGNVRAELETVVSELDRVLLAAQESAASRTRDRHLTIAVATAEAGMLIAHASALMDAADSAEIDEESAQANVDLLFGN